MNKAIKDLARGYQTEIAGRGAVPLDKLTHEECLVELMHAIDAIEALQRFLGDAGEVIETWSKGNR